ncbi:TetR family transcriptional regulator [Jatrophihabitans sp. GAS493]|uniref:TetR/AcrR family transcriptional regulator n=1 Tax=Jatrophihabitans sp. GAS493 TaxID=1907575 RepID=UPI000BB6A006|nr:TetR/AcrR family transcriptional regulator [Jatrophihabitans sp. GAS493]SOD74240.1 TetR family transcriptional regulator [Jatrophihabitans sp. GAS493]
MTGIGSGAGRPRHAPVQREGSTGREQILDAASELFSEWGYGAASTRRIAEAVGVKQASIYYHFSNKQEILASLLAGTVRPSLDFSRRLARTHEPAHVQLYALTHFDVELLSSGKWNVGALYTLPELRAEQFAPFRHERELLRRAYGRRVESGATSGSFCLDDADVATSLVFALAESVIARRADGRRPHPDLPDLVATAALRLLHCEVDDLATAAVECKRMRALAPPIPK